MSPDFEKLARGRLEEMDSYNLTERAYYNLLIENGRLLAQVDQLRAELVAITPNWDDAPEWAVRHIIESFYLDGFNETGKPVRIEERRPEATP